MSNPIDMFRVDGQNAIVTGGSQGIGLELACALAEAGANVVIADILLDKGKAAVEELGEAGAECRFVETDVSRRGSVKRMLDVARESFGNPQILINCAGIMRRGLIAESEDEDWDAVMNVNLKGVWICSQEVGREMMECGYGRIVNISSVAAAITQPHQGIYALTKAGVSHLTRITAFEWAPYGITVNAIAPGPTQTDMTRAYFDNNPDVLENRLRAIPMGRLGEPCDYVGAALFLATKASSFVTGQTLFVDGGFLLSR